MNSQRMDSLEACERAVKQKEMLMKEVEKLKSDIKALRKSNIGNSLFNIAKSRNDTFDSDKLSVSA